MKFIITIFLFLKIVKGYLLCKTSRKLPIKIVTRFLKSPDIEICQWDLPKSYSDITIGIPREIYRGEKRVAQSPDSVVALLKEGFRVIIESNAGILSDFPDSLYEVAGVEVADDASRIWKCDIVLKIRPPTIDEATKLEDRCLLSFIYPAQNDPLLKLFQDQNSTVFAMDCIPR